MPDWFGPSQGSSSARASSPPSIRRPAPMAPAATAAPPAAPWISFRRETPLKPASPLYAERPLHPRERLGEGLDRLLDVAQLVVRGEASAPAQVVHLVEGGGEGVVDLVGQVGVLGLDERRERVVELAR